MSKLLLILFASFLLFTSCDNSTEPVEKVKNKVKFNVLKFKTLAGKDYISYEYSSDTEQNQIDKIIQLMRYDDKVKIKLNPEKEFQIKYKNKDDKFYYILEIEDTTRFRTQIRYNLYILKNYILWGYPTYVINDEEFNLGEIENESYFINKLSEVKEIIIEEK